MSKLIKTMLVSLFSIVILSVATFVIIVNIPGNSEKTGAETIDDVIEYSYETSDITTDLKDGSFVRIQFQIITDGKKAKEEVEKRDFQIKNILIKEIGRASCRERVKNKEETQESNKK